MRTRLLKPPLKIRPLSGLMATHQMAFIWHRSEHSKCTTVDLSSLWIPNASDVFHVTTFSFPWCAPPTTMKLSSLDNAMARIQPECETWNFFEWSGPEMKQLLAKRLSFDGFFMSLKCRSLRCSDNFDIIFFYSNWQIDWSNDRQMKLDWQRTGLKVDNK